MLRKDTKKPQTLAEILPEKISVRLKMTRLWRNIGVRELERLTADNGKKVSRGTVSALELGRQGRVEVETLRLLSQALRVPPEWITYGSMCPIPQREIRRLELAMKQAP